MLPTAVHSYEEEEGSAARIIPARMPVPPCGLGAIKFVICRACSCKCCKCLAPHAEDVVEDVVA